MCVGVCVCQLGKVQVSVEKIEQYGQVQDNFGLVKAFQIYQPEWLVPEKIKIQPWM